MVNVTSPRPFYDVWTDAHPEPADPPLIWRIAKGVASTTGYGLVRYLRAQGYKAQVTPADGPAPDELRRW